MNNIISDMVCVQQDTRMSEVALRPAESADEDFLRALYASTRAEEISAWGWDCRQAEPFLIMQYNAQRMSYQAQFPDADHHIICVGEQRIGRVLVDRSGPDIILVDISLVPDYCNRGIGARFMRRLIDEAAASGRVLRLHVSKTNRAQRLYQRLGFVITEDTGMHYAMAWQPRDTE